MSRKLLIPLLAAVTAAFVIAPGLSALAQFNPSSIGGAGQATGQGKSNTSDRMGGGGGAKAAGGTARMGGGGGTKAGGGVNRMGGGGGAKGAQRSRNLNSSRSN
jgi:hypothetical protein